MLTVFRLQLGTGLSRHEAGHEAVVVLGTDAALGGDGGRDGHRGSDVGPCDDRTAGGRGGRGGRGCGLSCSGQVLLLWVHIDGVQADLGGAAGLPLVLHGYRTTQHEGPQVWPSDGQQGATVTELRGWKLTVFVHAGLQTLLQPTRLTLVPVGFVHWTHAGTCLAPVDTIKLLKSNQNRFVHRPVSG